jgi:hypothetical protein
MFSCALAKPRRLSASMSSIGLRNFFKAGPPPLTLELEVADDR